MEKHREENRQRQRDLKHSETDLDGGRESKRSHTHSHTPGRALTQPP